MASMSMSSLGWESVVEDTPEIDNHLLMALLEESQVEESEDERLGCVIQSLKAEIDHNEIGGNGLVKPECENHDHQIDYELGTVGLDDGHYCSRSMCQIDDPFDWVDMDMVTNSHCDEMGNWYVGNCTEEMKMMDFVDGGDYSPFYCGDGDYSIEHAYSYSPLWQESYASNYF